MTAKSDRVSDCLLPSCGFLGIEIEIPLFGRANERSASTTSFRRFAMSCLDAVALTASRISVSNDESGA